MAALSNKSKQYGLIALKVFILCVTFGYVYYKLRYENIDSLEEVAKAIGRKSVIPVLAFLGMAALNWLLEIVKWKRVTAVIKKQSFASATKEQLASLSLSIATPNRIGEYGAKAYFYEVGLRKKVLLLNLFTNLSQLLITLFFGVLGLLVMSQMSQLPIDSNQLLSILILVLAGGILVFIFREKQWLFAGLSLANIYRYYKNLPRSITWNVLFLSMLRYIIFSILFFLVLGFFDAKITLQTSLVVTSVMYLLVSIIPTFFILDVVVKTGVAVWLFSLVEVPEITVLATVLSMWLLNFVAPAIWGSFYVFSKSHQ